MLPRAHESPTSLRRQRSRFPEGAKLRGREGHHSCPGRKANDETQEPDALLTTIAKAPGMGRMSRLLDLFAHKVLQPKVARLRILPRPLGPRNYLQASGAGLWRPLHGHRTEAGAGRRRFTKPRLGYTRAADLLEAGHAARARVARGHPYGPHPCRWRRVARPAVPLPHYSRAKDHGRPLVGPAVFWPQAAAAGLLTQARERPMARVAG